MLRVAQRRRFCIDGIPYLTHIGITQYTETLGICRHKAVLDPVVDHLYKVSGTIGAAMQVALFGGATEQFTSRCSRSAGNAWRECRENRVHVRHRIFFPTNHHAVAPIKTPYATAGPNIYIMNFLPCKLLGATNVVDVVRVAAVNENVVGLEMCEQVGDILIHSRCRHHQPDRSGLRELSCKIRQRICSHCSLPSQLFYRLLRPVEDYTLVLSSLHKPHHVGPPPSETDHSDLHKSPPAYHGCCHFPSPNEMSRTSIATSTGSGIFRLFASGA